MFRKAEIEINTLQSLDVVTISTDIGLPDPGWQISLGEEDEEL